MNDRKIKYSINNKEIFCFYDTYFVIITYFKLVGGCQMLWEPLKYDGSHSLISYPNCFFDMEITKNCHAQQRNKQYERRPITE